jgi:CheY-like chemotaxis protein
LKIIETGPAVLPPTQTADVDDGEPKNVNAKILLVEDNKVNQMVATFTLKKLGFENVVVAADGLIALEILKTCDSDDLFDVILMDCQMPNLDGYQTTKAIRSAQVGEDFTSIAIIAMTANAMQGDKEKCLESGMSDYLSKPIDVDELNKKLITWLDK